MAREIEALDLNKSWTIEDLTPDEKPINCKLVKQRWLNVIKRALLFEKMNKL